MPACWCPPRPNAQVISLTGAPLPFRRSGPDAACAPPETLLPDVCRPSTKGLAAIDGGHHPRLSIADFMFARCEESLFLMANTISG